MACAEELSTRSQIGFYIYQILKQRNLKEREIATLLNVSELEVSHLINGHFSHFTTERLLVFLQCLNMKVTISIAPHQNGEAFDKVVYTA